MEIIEQFKGGIEGENKDALIKGVSEILEGQGLKVLNEDGVKALFSDNTKKAVSDVHEELGKRGLEPLKNESNEEHKYFKQAFLHLDKVTEANKGLMEKVSELEKAQTSGDSEKINTITKELAEYQKLYKETQSKLEAQGKDFESKFAAQRQLDSINNGLVGLKFKEGVSNEDIDSAKAFAISQVSAMPTEIRDGVTVFLDSNGDAMRNEADKNKYITPQDLLKAKLSFIIDQSKQTKGIGVTNNQGDGPDETKSSTTFVYNGEATKSKVWKSIEKFAEAKGVPATSFREDYLAIIEKHQLK